ncbi:MAG TPA: hypothetical protein DDY57_03635 [Franconibacter pulveris]|nr:hypothetical protein [Franconibacter pulveris]
MRSAPHHSEAKIASCTVLVPALCRSGAVARASARRKTNQPMCLKLISKAYARNEKGQHSWP